MHFHGTPSSRFEADNPDLDVIAKRLHVRFIVPDRPGHGLSTWKPYTIASYPDIVAQFADKLGLDRFAVIGLSGGGPFVIACAWKIPQRLTAAVIVGSPAPFDLPGVKDALSKEERQQYDLADKMPWLFRLFLWKFTRDARKNPASIHAMFANASEADKSLLTQPGVRRAFENMINGAFEQGTRAATHDWALLARPWGFSLKEIKMPVHLWQGEADTFIPVKHAQVLAEAIPNARARFFPNEGHILIVTHFEELLGTVLG
jgi:pimeloyl-ACP methyl ester carboxylesterase